MEEGKRVAAVRECDFWGLDSGKRMERRFTGHASMECILCQYYLLTWYSNDGAMVWEDTAYDSNRVLGSFDM